jgi:cytochrome c556
MRFGKVICGGIAAVALTSVAFAGGHGGADPSIGARQAVMSLYGYNLGILGAMAKGEVEYNAEVAAATAANFAALAGLDKSGMWPEGTAQGEVDGTRAAAKIWEDQEGFFKIFADQKAAADTLAATAGDGVEALQAGLGGVGRSCGACHEVYRGPRN